MREPTPCRNWATCHRTRCWIAGAFAPRGDLQQRSRALESRPRMQRRLSTIWAVTSVSSWLLRLALRGSANNDRHPPLNLGIVERIRQLAVNGLGCTALPRRIPFSVFAILNHGITPMVPSRNQHRWVPDVPGNLGCQIAHNSRKAA
jgi:hypothetical protein